MGAPWLWFSRLIMDDVALDGDHPATRVSSCMRSKTSRDMTPACSSSTFASSGECELAFIGLVPELPAKAMAAGCSREAVRLAWRDGVSRVHVHTCSLDHPAALAAYRRAGFMPFKRAIERFPDPRLLGIPAARLRASDPACSAASGTPPDALAGSPASCT